MNFKVIIPARYQSTRLPGKPLLDIAGKTMIQRVYEAAKLSKADEIIIATDDERIANCAKAFGASVCMTLASHPSGTDRLQEVASILGFDRNDIVVNVQGDEPMIPPALINQVAENLSRNTWASIASLCERMESLDSVFDPNNVKVVFNKQGEALYFSRAPIPWSRNHVSLSSVSLGGTSLNEKTSMKNSVSYEFKGNDLKQQSYYRHIGIYAYRAGFLNEYVKWQPSIMETVECLEQLRALDNGDRIHMDLACEAASAGVDTEKDLQEVRRLFSGH